MKSFICVLTLLALPFSALADSASDAAFLKQYYKIMAEGGPTTQKMSVMVVTPVPSCNDPSTGPTCLQIACGQGGYDCRYSSGLDKATAGCKGTEAACVDLACKQGGYDCRYSSGLDRVLALCHNAVGACVQTVCAQGGYDCRYSSGLDKAMAGCNGVYDPRCITEVCAQGGYDCRYSSGLDKAVGACKN